MIGVMNDGSAVPSEMTLFGVVDVLLLLVFVDGVEFDAGLGEEYFVVECVAAQLYFVADVVELHSSD